MPKSYLDIINKVDNFTYEEDKSFFRLLSHDGKTPLGLIDHSVAKYFQKSDFIFTEDAIQINPIYDTFTKRNDLFLDLASDLKSVPEFKEELGKGWRNELYVVYNPTSVPYFLVERAFSVLIGVVTYGVHLTGYVQDASGKLKIWVPRRSDTKPTFPSMMDNTVAGGLGYPYGIWETVVKECYEEAGLDEEFVKKNTKSAGVVQYMYRTSKGRVQPEVEYVFDIKFPENVIPHPVDGETQDFKLMEVEEVISKLDEFKPNCALVIIDFLIRHGYIGAEEDGFGELLVRLHRSFPYPGR